jgi:hypothetical protein
MLTRLIGTGVDLLLTASSVVAGQTVTDESIDVIFALGPVQTRIRIAFVHVGQTTGIIIAFRTLTFESVRQIVTFAAVRTRIVGALVDVDLAVTTREAGSTFAVLSSNGEESGRERIAISAQFKNNKLSVRTSGRAAFRHFASRS